jgi:hypothetical protein
MLQKKVWSVPLHQNLFFIAPLFANIFTIFILYVAINPAAPCAEKILVNNIFRNLFQHWVIFEILVLNSRAECSLHLQN